MRLLILGGTSEATRLAARLVDLGDVEPVLSLAGRTRAPAVQPVPTRIGGFGGADGLARYLRDEEIGAVIHDLRRLAVVESIFRAESGVGHEVVFLFTGRLDPMPAATGATMTEADGTVYPLVWRPFDQEVPPPLFPAATTDWLREVAG